ncbi:hypothetical protein L7F22_017567 [Adiantum nelumboides]|nr:hypothetical protein [Adiantum nelumboides]
MGGSTGRSAEDKLFSWPSAQLFLVDGVQHRALMESGAFALLLTTHSRCSQLALVEACVADLRWPVGKDSFVTMLETSNCTTARFLFSFPGSPSSAIKELEEVAGKYWARLAAGACVQSSVEYSGSKLQAKKERGNAPSSSMSSTGMLSKKMMKKIQKARRISAVAKLLSQAMARGVISGGAHVQVQEEAELEPEEAAATGRTPLKLVARRRRVVAKAEAVTRVVEAVERGATASWNLPLVSEAAKISSNLATWTLNEVGLRLLLNVTAAATCMRVAAPPTTASSASSSSLTLLQNSSSSSGLTPPATASRCLPPPRQRPPRPPAAHHHQLLSEASSLLQVVNFPSTLG